MKNLSFGAVMDSGTGMAGPRSRTRPEHAEWRASGADGVDMLRASYVTQSFPRHSHGCFVICVNERGAHGSWYRGATVVIPEGTVCVVPPGEVHTGHACPGAPWEYRATYPSVALLTGLAGEVGFPEHAVPSFPTLVINDPALARAFVDAHRRSERDGADAMGGDGAMTVLLTLLERHATGSRPFASTGERPSIQRALEFIQDCYARRITLDAIAGAAGVSRYAVLRTFRRHVHLSPHAFVTQVRVERAKALLRGPRRTPTSSCAWTSWAR